MECLVDGVRLVGRAHLPRIQLPAVVAFINLRLGVEHLGLHLDLTHLNVHQSLQLL